MLEQAGDPSITMEWASSFQWPLYMGFQSSDHEKDNCDGPKARVGPPFLFIIVFPQHEAGLALQGIKETARADNEHLFWFCRYLYGVHLPAAVGL